MALPPLTQPTFLGGRDPMIRDPFAPSIIEPGYIRDSDLESGFVRYPKAGGRLVEKEHNVKLPRLEKLKLKTQSGPTLGKVNGFALTPELKELFKGT